MTRPALHSTVAALFGIAAASALVAACAPEAALAPAASPTELAARPVAENGRASRDRGLAALRHASARYHDLTAAEADGFVFLHGCEARPDEGPVGMVYVHPGRLDGTIDADDPE